MKNSKINFVLKIALAIILLQTLFYKFTASPESVYIFSKLNAEPLGRISSGIVELFTSFLLFFNRTKFYASVVILCTMLVALFSHIFVLGIEIMNDGGTLFILGCICFILSAYFSILYKDDFINNIHQLKTK
ncbi:MAG: hypothetical protein QM535_22280 [Limnohabitans sp.]|nr:hypothetical protein [Limnohabitans sp.]